MKKLILTSALVLLAGPAVAKEFTVKMVTDPDAKQPYAFSPSKLTIQPGDTVTFVNAQDDTHNVMIDGAPKAFTEKIVMSPTLETEGQAWSYTFDVPGTYTFHCHPHQALDMKGQIIVGEASKPEDMRKIAHEHGDSDDHSSHH